MKTKSYRCCVRAWSLTAALLLAASSAFAQAPVDTTRHDSVTVAPKPAEPVRTDTLLFIPQESKEAAAEVANPVDFEKHLTQPPTLALFKSMLVPGLGQLGNHRYVKAALFAGLEGWLAVKSIHYAGLTRDARAVYDQATTYSARFNAFQNYDATRKNRNKYIWFCGLAVFVSMFDAYVDAHLSGSPVDRRNEGISMDVRPSTDGGAQALISYSF